ncbi:unnamed protein product [Choristocarpus tenellus]
MAGRSSRRKVDGGERIKALVEEKLGQGLQYEALQLYRGLVSRKSARGDHDGAVAVAEQGISVLVRGGVVDSATELASVMVGIFVDNELPPTEGRLSVIKRVNEVYEDAKRADALAAEDKEKEGQKSIGGSRSREDASGGEEGQPSIGQLQVRFLKLAVNWTARRGQWVNGDPGVCALLGRSLWGEKQTEKGTKYLVLGERPGELCDLICQHLPQQSDRESAVTQGMLQFVSRENLRDANALQDAYKKQCPKGEVLGPLPTFCGLLLKTCEYDAGPVFQQLLDKYKPSLSKEAGLFPHVESIAKIYFRIEMRPPSVLENIMGMFAAS